MYIVKLFLCFIIFEIPTYIGFWLSKRLNRKVAEYNQINDILLFLETNIKYNNSNLIEIFDDIVKQTSNSNFKLLFNDISNNLKKGDLSINECFIQSIDKYKNEFSCDLDIFIELSKMLGKSDIEGQIKNIELAKDKVKILKDNAIIHKNKNEKMYKSLGVICGVMLVIMLL